MTIIRVRNLLTTAVLSPILTATPPTPTPAAVPVAIAESDAIGIPTKAGAEFAAVGHLPARCPMLPAPNTAPGQNPAWTYTPTPG